MCMLKMEVGLIKTGRTEEFNNQFQDNVSLGVLMKLTLEERNKYSEPPNNITIKGVKTGPYATTPHQDWQEQQREATAPLRS
jgi:hypothetical protein